MKHSYTLIILLSFILASCNLGAPAPQDPAAVATSAAQTVEAVLTSPAASPTARAQATSTATSIPGVAIDGTTAEAPQCEENSEILAWTRDGVAYDKTEAEKALAPGKGFVMSWILKNTGTCVWNDGYKMTFDSGERLTQADTFAVMPFGYHVQPGEELTITIQMTAPTAPGKYESTFRFLDPNGNHVSWAIAIATWGGPCWSVPRTPSRKGTAWSPPSAWPRRTLPSARPRSSTGAWPRGSRRRPRTCG